MLRESAFASLDRDSPTKVDFANDDRAPMLLIAFEFDHIVPRASPATTPRSTQGRRPSPSSGSFPIAHTSQVLQAMSR